MPSPQISISWLAAELGFDHFAADGGGRFFAAAVPGAVRTVDVVEARHARVQAEILAEVAAHALAEQLLPAVAVFGQRRVSVLFLQPGIVGIASACRRCRRRPRKNRSNALCRIVCAACSMWVLIRTDSMHRALLFSMKPMPPMLAAKL